MSLTLNVKARNAILDSGLDALFNNGKLRFYSGAKPATANLAPTGTLLADITLPADALAAASAGSKAKAGTWADASADGGSATAAGWFRFSETGDDGSLDGNFHRIDGTFGADMTADGAVTAGQAVSVSSFSFTLPAGS
jgi:hypothetical protein